MPFSLVVHDSAPLSRSTKRSSLLTFPRRPEAAPIPPTLVNSPYLSSPNSIFQRRTTVLKWPSQVDNEWLRDMVPMDRFPASDADAISEGLIDPTPSPTSSDGSHRCSLSPPSPLLRSRFTTPDVAPPAQRALGGSGVGPSPYN